MKEQILVTTIGDEIDVTVHFDYQPEEEETHNYPGCDSEVTINAVYVGGDEEKDIEDCLCPATIAMLEERCEQMLIDESEDDR